MARLDLPEGISGIPNLPNTLKSLINCFNDGEGHILGRPGFDLRSVPSIELARAAFKWNGFFYGVWGTELRRVDDVVTGATTFIGTIDGAETIEHDFGFNETVICVPDGKSYTLDKFDNVVDITPNPNFQSARDVAHIDGRFVYIPSNGDPAFFSDVGDAGSIQPLSFFDAESLPDLNTGVINFRNTLYILGEDSNESFRNTGGVPNPFTRIQGARQDFGFIGGLVEHTKGFLYLGREKGQNYGFYATGGGTTVKISNAVIDDALSQYTPNELRQVIPNRFKWLGHDIITFTLFDNSWGFFNGKWFELDTLIDGFFRPWLGGYISEYQGEYYSASRGQFGILGAFNTDFGERNQKAMVMGFKHDDNKRFSCQSIEIGITQGFNLDVGTVGLMMTRDGIDYGPALYRNLGALGKYHDKLVWNYAGGLGNYDGFMGIKIFTTEDVIFNTDSMYLYLR